VQAEERGANRLPDLARGDNLEPVGAGSQDPALPVVGDEAGVFHQQARVEHDGQIVNLSR
jgi:hypothetical protein